MSGQTQLIFSMFLIVVAVSGLVYSVVLLQQCQKIIKRMKKRSNWYIKQIDKSLKDY